MAWGINLPNSFGDYFLDGDYVGYHERLEDYYLHRMSDAEKAAMDMQDGIRFSTFADKFTRDRGALIPEEQPQVFRAETPFRTPGSLIKLTSRLMAVDDALKAIIEGLEPGVHQYWPIRIQTYKGEDHPTRYHGLVIRQFRDAFLPDQSNMAMVEQMSGKFYPMSPTKKCMDGLTLSQQAIGSAQLWRDSRLAIPDIFMSDALQSEIRNAGLRVPKHFKMKVV